MDRHPLSMPDITFTNADFHAPDPDQDDPMVITAQIALYDVSNVLVDQDSSINILYWATTLWSSAPPSPAFIYFIHTHCCFHTYSFNHIIFSCSLSTFITHLLISFIHTPFIHYNFFYFFHLYFIFVEHGGVVRNITKI